MNLIWEKIQFKVFDALKLPQDNLNCFNVCIIQNAVEEVFQVHWTLGRDKELELYFSLGLSTFVPISGTEATSCTEKAVFLCFALVVFVCLAEDVKLSAYGRQPIL
jgi:hypothetical protein